MAECGSARSSHAQGAWNMLYQPLFNDMICLWRIYRWQMSQLLGIVQVEVRTTLTESGAISTAQKTPPERGTKGMLD